MQSEDKYLSPPLLIFLLALPQVFCQWSGEAHIWPAKEASYQGTLLLERWRSGSQVSRYLPRGKVLKEDFPTELENEEDIW